MATDLRIKLDVLKLRDPIPKLESYLQHQTSSCNEVNNTLHWKKVIIINRSKKMHKGGHYKRNTHYT